MTSKEFVDQAIKIQKLNTAYASGTFGQKFSEPFIRQKREQYPSSYPDSKIRSLRNKAANGDLYLFDCCGLIKGIIWNWPNLVYKSNGLPDVNDSGIWNQYCIEKSHNWDKIEPGEILHMKGHVGIYIGEGKAIEATARWTENVLISNVMNNNMNPWQSRKWEEHGKLKLLKYNEDATYVAPQEDGVYIEYTVKKGDTLSAIAYRHNMTLIEIIKLNPQIPNPNLIYPGQKICIMKEK